MIINIDSHFQIIDFGFARKIDSTDIRVMQGAVN